MLQKLLEEASGLDLFKSGERGTPVTKVSGLRPSRLTGVPEASSRGGVGGGAGRSLWSMAGGKRETDTSHWRKQLRAPYRPRHLTGT